MATISYKESMKHRPLTAYAHGETKMAEEEKKEEPPEEKQPEQDKINEDPPDEQSKDIATPDLIDKANEAAERLEKANEQHSKLLVKQEKLNVERTLGGHAEAGTTEKTKEEKEIEDCKRYLKGTGMEDAIN